ncbi:IDEAL domain-containing protein, partial [Virgibacillus sp. W0430]|uniref:IDEAL domain-containing protein n=1 Tax=Virgibacillus sp. W0430 TaxID=3391580 RepID=UPI003F460263
KTQEVANIEAKFAFQKGKDIIYITMKKLISLPDFLIQLHTIVKPYYADEEGKNNSKREDACIITELERHNVKRLIDTALDERDEKSFYKLVKLL